MSCCRVTNANETDATFRLLSIAFGSPNCSEVLYTASCDAPRFLSHFIYFFIFIYICINVYIYIYYIYIYIYLCMSCLHVQNPRNALRVYVHMYTNMYKSSNVHPPISFFSSPRSYTLVRI